ncbi:MAG: ATPase [Clostridiales Family XIII bacterium]|jgi:sugar (pentulose or hexulose) kinase|nr:ATPase [Clostridiales Family XIII bacterium]
MKKIDFSKTYLGIELGSTRIKSVLIDGGFAALASGSYEWENRFEDGVWTYGLDDVEEGIRASFAALAKDVLRSYGEKLRSVGGVGISAMMHGYLVFDADGSLLAPFRTWRNTTTGRAAAELTELFGFNVPLRWSVAHLYQAILDDEPHVPEIARVTTLSSYVHRKLTGRDAVGVGDASGMFPVDSTAGTYDDIMMAKFDGLIADKGYSWRLRDILPEVLQAGAGAGALTPEGAIWLDPSGTLLPGAPACPPEGDAGTGMVATGAVAGRTGNISAGTSVFAMVVLEKPLSRYYTEIDMVTTPAGRPVAMVHCNNCTSDIDAWVRLFGEAAALLGANTDRPALYDALYRQALAGDSDCGGLLSYNYLSGEPITGFDEGLPLLLRVRDARFTFANLSRSLLFSAMATLRIGMDILTDNEDVLIDRLLGHGGLFKVKGVAQSLMSSALGIPVSVMETAGEGGAWGIAVLAAYSAQRASGVATAPGSPSPSPQTDASTGAATVESLEEYLENRVFAGMERTEAEPDSRDAEGFAAYLERYKAGLAVERAAVGNI